MTDSRQSGPFSAIRRQKASAERRYSCVFFLACRKNLSLCRRAFIKPSAHLNSQPPKAPRDCRVAALLAMTQIQLIFTKHILLLPSRLYCHCERSEAISSYVFHIILSGFSSVTQLLCVTLSAPPQNKRQAFRPAFVLHAYLIDGKHSMPAVREHPLQRQTKLLRPQSEI